MLLHSPSFERLLHHIMSTANIQYPPAVHPYHGESAQNPTITSVQPRAGTTMAVETDNDTGRTGKAERLRGGCVPCPVCAESLVCTHLTQLNVAPRTEACVGSSRYRSVVAEENRVVPAARKYAIIRAGGHQQVLHHISLWV